MRSVIRSSNMQSVEPTGYKKLCGDKNCQSARCYKKSSPRKPMCATDKNYQSKPVSIMQSVTKSSIMQLPKPAMKQSNPVDKNCQSANNMY